VAILQAEMTPLLCVGESLDVRQDGDQVDYTLAQLDGGLTGLTAEQAGSLVIAYEPVWAIGTGETATPADAQEMCAALRARISAVHGHAVAGSMRILYGGSVKADSMPAIMAEPDVDGALVGGASLDASEFVRICRYREARG
jgi:triosephosphate isomerase